MTELELDVKICELDVYRTPKNFCSKELKKERKEFTNYMKLNQQPFSKK